MCGTAEQRVIGRFKAPTVHERIPLSEVLIIAENSTAPIGAISMGA
jgi:hypothetical protein